MFKIHAIGNNQVSMKILSVCLLLCMGVMCHAQGFEQSTLDEYLYGPYFNDLAIETMDESAIGTFFNKKTCNEARLTELHQAFFEPGAWRNVTSNKDLHNVVVCAWGGQQNATHLMEKLVYAQQLKEQVVTENRQLRSVIYHPNYIRKVAKTYPKILRAIPDSHPMYLNLALDIVRQTPSAFNDVTLRFKRHPQMTKLMFQIKPTYDDMYKHLAIQYSVSDQERKEYIMHNGLLYLELPIEVRDNPYLAYHAYVQNDFVYPFIPKRIVDVFNADGTIMVPRYMTKVTLVRQKLANGWRAALAPLKDLIPSDDTLDDVVVNIDEETATQNATDEPSEDAITFDNIEFKNERTVVTDIRLINKIENKKDRRLLNLWRIARFGDDGQVFVAMFRPDGKDNLGTIVIKQKERIMFSDYAAVFSMDGESIWRIDDDGTFSAKSFILNRVVKSSEGYLNFSFRWKGKYTTNEFNLVDQSGMLIKEFINYYFE